MPTTLNTKQMREIAQNVDLSAVSKIIDKYIDCRSRDRKGSDRGWNRHAIRACDLQQTLGSIADYARDFGPECWGPIRAMLYEREVFGDAMRYMRLGR